MVSRGGKATGVGAKKRERRREQGKEPMLPHTFDNTYEPQRGRPRPVWLAYIQTAAHRAMQTASANKYIDGPAGRGGANPTGCPASNTVGGEGQTAVGC